MALVPQLQTLQTKLEDVASDVVTLENNNLSDQGALVLCAEFSSQLDRMRAQIAEAIRFRLDHGDP